MTKSVTLKSVATAVIAAAVLVLPVAVRAKAVAPQEAEGLARRVVESRHGQRGGLPTGGADVRLRHTAKTLGRGVVGGTGLAKSAAGGGRQEAALFYVFNVAVGADSGFVIVAGDDVIRPVLGYSDNGAFDENDLPPNFAYWLDYLRRQAEYALEHGLGQSEAVRREWDDYAVDGVRSLSKAASSAAAAAVSPLIKTTWNQTAPYNGLCPTVNYPYTSGTRTATGCVATAMAQIMKYHGHPTLNYTVSKAYTTKSRKFDMPAELLGDYNWSGMLNAYAAANSGTAAQRDAVAKLMYHAGLSVEMNYDTSGSGAYAINVPMALTEYFDYDKSIQLKRRNAYDAVSWENLLKEQLNIGLPMYYSGFPSVDADAAAAGHAFVCDGYDEYGRFHFNWGWGGKLDGYFVTTALNPGAGGTGAGSGTYNDNQQIVINIRPNYGGAASACELALRYKFTAGKISVTPMETFAVEFGVENTGWRALPATVFFGAALVDNNSRIVEIVGKDTLICLDIGGGYRFLPSQSRISSCRVSDNVPLGTYKLKMVFSVDGGTSWIPINLSYDNIPNSIDFKVYHVPPTITAHPANQTVATGGTAKFTVAATSNGAGALTYQWQVNTSGSAALPPRNITVSMRDQTGDGWNGGSLKITVNGTALSTNPMLNTGGTGTYTFKVNPGDAVAFYWNISNYNSECAFAAYYADAPPAAAFNPAPGALNDTAALLVYRQYGGLISAGGALLGSFTATAATDANVFSAVSTGSGAASATYTTPAATTAMSGYRYRCIVSNKYAMSDTSEYATITVTPNAVMSPNRAIPISSGNDVSAVLTPPSALTAEFTAGPNPAARRGGAVNIFCRGARISDCELRVYDASGNIVTNVKISDRGTVGESAPTQSVYARRLVGSWDLTDAKGRLVPAGTYMVRGAADAPHGKKENVAVLVGVR